MKHTQRRGEWIGSRGEFLIERHIADAMAAPHWHDHVELNLLMEGRMTYLFNGRQEQVEAGRLVLFWAAIPHQTIAVAENAPLVCLYLPLIDFLGLPVDRKARQSIMQGRFLAQANPETMDALTLPRWEKEWQSGSAARRKLVVEEVRLRIRRLILDNAESDNSPTYVSPTSLAGHAVRRVELLIDLINSRYADPTSVPDLAKLAGMHPSTANSAFREVLGISVNEYLTRHRIARAMQLLTDTDVPVLQIGFDCGFGSSSRFYEIFKERTGTTPRHFREAVNSKNTPAP
ncbi:helix-turn-helix domain-containing protein (plasmid) [Rhizobium ruizarguesonis]|jgi:AraC-like DNA-binding protein|uniref:helix-turn-helix domain-containing protein n=1 Tax=Rhizobium ruizarguesonis TaxID=2081791 RepID=UPI00103028E8|nr:helix-turn-helix domain-containing protein [Rhizobium ruizarguesonis]MBY5804790.1 helix-turn-helix domain-containing protein [Rhizobium leguminosarum]TBY69499.1 helix-turn-helix domain-containing protein [Rhizobium leguminosarum bv. viciae]MBY5844983.1 helix-turn-helix domain-containing protein [Rhizobium leguminosarum]MBY5885890.1 helix-turn-helix domain-containing protein [Rhizobium leguminosarum]NEH36882.1 helix-turn-helix domain-containing protein [Rhizobium ruizarguesonis]